MHRVVKKSDEDTRKITLPAVSLGSKVLAVTSGMSISAVKGTVGPGEGGWGQSTEKEQHKVRPVSQACAQSSP